MTKLPISGGHVPSPHGDDANAVLAVLAVHAADLVLDAVGVDDARDDLPEAGEVVVADEVAERGRPVTVGEPDVEGDVERVVEAGGVDVGDAHGQAALRDELLVGGERLQLVLGLLHQNDLGLENARELVHREMAGVSHGWVVAKIFLLKENHKSRMTSFNVVVCRVE